MNDKFPITITKEYSGFVTKEELSYALMSIAAQIAGVDDDAGCDWKTYHSHDTYIGGLDWCVSIDPNVATLVDAANVLRYGKPLIITEADTEQQLQEEREKGL